MGGPICCCYLIYTIWYICLYSFQINKQPVIKYWGQLFYCISLTVLIFHFYERFIIMFFFLLFSKKLCWIFLLISFHKAIWIFKKPFYSLLPMALLLASRDFFLGNIFFMGRDYFLLLIKLLLNWSSIMSFSKKLINKFWIISNVL